jgi:nucleotide-binding universal stress UspA family protein
VHIVTHSSARRGGLASKLPQGGSEGEGATRTFAEPMIALKHVAVATDFGDAADAALAYGRALAMELGATLHVVHATDDLGMRMAVVGGALQYGMDLERFQQEVIAAAEKEFARRLTAEDVARLQVRTAVLTGHSPVNDILQYVRDNAIDLLVCGTHGRGPVSHLLMGSVAERLVRLAPCPVLVVRHPEREFVLPDTPTIERGEA